MQPRNVFGSNVRHVPNGTGKVVAKNQTDTTNDNQDICDDIHKLLGVDKKIDLDKPLTDKEKMDISQKEKSRGGSMCGCYGICLPVSETFFVESREHDLHQVCKKLLYIQENERTRPMYTRTVTQLTGTDGTKKNLSFA